MKLAYQDIATAAPGVPAVVLHREGMTSVDGPTGVARASAGVGRVCDLLDDLQLHRPVLIGWGQGGVVAVGAGLLRAGQVGSVVSVDAPSGHFDLLPARARAAEARPPMLLAATDPSGGPVLDQQQHVLSGGRVPITWCCPDEGTPDDRDKALSARIGQWLEGG
jgi:pimeloyl-ACP methyl ester carboxylesterase